jgi:hypothetical protein
MALALRLDHLLQTGVIADYSELAELGKVSRARVSQIMNLVHLAPDIQERILFLPCTERGRDPVHLGQLQPLAQRLDWREQRELWRQLCSIQHETNLSPVEATRPSTPPSARDQLR